MPEDNLEKTYENKKGRTWYEANKNLLADTFNWEQVLYKTIQKPVWLTVGRS